MASLLVSLEPPISQYIDHHTFERDVSPQQALMELVNIGFDTLLQENYRRYRGGEISFGRLAQLLGMTSWELSHFLEERNWKPFNLPSEM